MVILLCIVSFIMMHNALNAMHHSVNNAESVTIYRSNYTRYCFFLIERTLEEINTLIKEQEEKKDTAYAQFFERDLKVLKSYQVELNQKLDLHQKYDAMDPQIAQENKTSRFSVLKKKKKKSSVQYPSEAHWKKVFESFKKSKKTAFDIYDVNELQTRSLDSSIILFDQLTEMREEWMRKHSSFS